jgi:deoxyribonuclease-4
VGCHVFVSGGLRRAPERALERGADVVQIFPSNPRGWAIPNPDRAEEDAVRERLDELGFPLFLHAPYLVNVAARDSTVLERSVENLEFALARGARLGARGVVVHTGSSGGDDRTLALERASTTLLHLLDRVEGCDLLVELTAGSGNLLASTVEEIVELIAACDAHPRVRVCIDTCHLFAAGLDITRPETQRALRTQLQELDPARVTLVHVNDSRDPVGSRRDRHARIGRGEIGIDALAAVARLPELAHAPLVIETPGDATEQRDDLALLRRVATAC